MRIGTAGRAVLAATWIAVGILGVVQGDFAAVWRPVPTGVPAREALIVLCALVPLACGMGLLWRRTAASAARAMVAYLALWFVGFRLPVVLHAPATQEPWSNAGEVAVYVAGALALCGDRGVRIARVVYGLALIPFGVAHFTFSRETAQRVPAWLPAHEFWAYFTGGAFVAAGVAVLLDRCARWAATLSALQMGLFTVLVWLPIVAAGAGAGEWNEFVISCTLVACAWTVADSYRGTPWLAVAGARYPTLTRGSAR